MIDASAREPHFADHLVPVWKALPKKLRGTFYVASQAMAAHVEKLGVEAVVEVVPNSSRLVLTASWGDLRHLGTQTKSIYLEHGSGISYGDKNSSYAGGEGKENVVLFICPNENVERLNRDTYPETPTVVVGCPKLDKMKSRGVQGRTVAISFHWPCALTPESSWAYPFYRNYLRKLGEKAECEVIGHAHPRAWNQLASVYKRIGIEPVKSFSDVMDRADLYVVDNSSTLYEAAALGRPTVVMNSPHYRRDINLGMRFWDGIPGPQVNHGMTLAETVKDMLDGGWMQWETERLEAVRLAYGPRGNDGSATKRTVDAIKRLVK